MTCDEQASKVEYEYLFDKNTLRKKGTGHGEQYENNSRVRLHRGI